MINNNSRLESKTILLDFNFTLLLCSNYKKYDYDDKVRTSSNLDKMGHITYLDYRPYLRQFLEKISKYYELIIYSRQS